MGLYVIGYDYHKERDYRRLYEILAQWKAVPLLESLWLANLNGSAPAVRNALQKVGDSDDTFAVIELKAGSDWAATKGTKKGCAEWLRAHIKA